MIRWIGLSTSKRMALAVCGVVIAGLSACDGIEPGEGSGEPTGEDTEALCPSSIDSTRSLFVTDQTALDNFGFKTVMDQLIKRGGTAPQTSLQLYQQWWKTNDVKSGSNPLGCTTTFNGFSRECPRMENILSGTNPFANPLTNKDAYITLGLVNRFDLAPVNGANCGEYRVVFGKRSGLSDGLDRNLLIFEARLPNPTPETGLAGCAPVAQFWANLSSDNDPVSRAAKLKKFYFTGLSGFEPVLDPAHYANGTGQIRTNQFMPGRNSIPGQFWQLREYKLAKNCTTTPCKLEMHDVTVRNNPAAALFANGGDATFQTTDFINQVPALAVEGSDINAISMKTKNIYNWGESTEDSRNDYVNNAGSNIKAKIQAKLTAIGSDLSPDNILNRATTQSCAGCHQNSPGRDMGGDMPDWPASNVFTQIDENKNLSPAVGVFLTHRSQVLTDFLCGGAPALGPDAEAPLGGGSGIE